MRERLQVTVSQGFGQQKGSKKVVHREAGEAGGVSAW